MSAASTITSMSKKLNSYLSFLKAAIEGGQTNLPGEEFHNLQHHNREAHLIGSHPPDLT